MHAFVMRRGGRFPIRLGIHVYADDGCRANAGANGVQVHVCVYANDNLTSPGRCDCGCDDRHRGDEHVHGLLLREYGCGCDYQSKAIPHQAERSEQQSRR